MTGQRLREAGGVTGVLAAGWEIFDLISSLAAACAEQAADLYPAFMFARSAAAGGRNAIAFAPSAPASGAELSRDPDLPAGDAGEVADALAGLASALSVRLRAAAPLAEDDGDRVACQHAAIDAERIAGLLAGSA